MRKINKIIVHCTATQESKDVSLDEVRRWHLNRGWRDIGYHFLIQRDGTVEEGRPIEQSGAHTKGHNWDNNYSTKSCPCFDAKLEYQNISERF